MEYSIIDWRDCMEKAKHLVLRVMAIVALCLLCCLPFLGGNKVGADASVTTHILQSQMMMHKTKADGAKPQFTNGELPTAYFGEYFFFQFTFDTTDITEFSNSYWNNSWGIKFDSEARTISGIPASIAYWPNTTFTVKNDYGETNKNYIINIVKGNIADEDVPDVQLKARLGQSLSDIKNQLPSGWRFADESVVLDQLGINDIEAIYNPNAANWNDKTAFVHINVQDVLAPSDPHPTLDVKVGQRIGDVALPQGFRYAMPDTVFETVGNYEIVLYYNQDPDVYADYVIDDAPITVSKLDAQSPEFIPSSLTAFVGLVAQDLSLPSGWRFIDESYQFALEDVGVQGKNFEAAYNPNPDRYLDYPAIISVRVFEGVHGAPSSPPKVEVQVGQSAGDVSLPQYYAFVDTQFVFDTLGEIPVTVNYNTDPNNFADYQFDLMVTVGLRDGLYPDNIPSFESQIGAQLSALSLPEYFVWETPEFAFTQGGDILVRALYNKDTSLYKDTVVEITVSVEFLDGLQPNDNEIPSPEARIGQKLSEVSLPLYFVWENPNATIDTEGVIPMRALYNENPNVYKDTVVSIAVKVVGLPGGGGGNGNNVVDSGNDGGLFSNRLVLYSVIGVGALFVLVISVVLISAGGKKKAKPSPVIQARVTRPPPGARSPYSSYNSLPPSGYGRSANLLPPPPNALPMSRSYMVHSQTFNENPYASHNQASPSYGNALRSQVRMPYDQSSQGGGGHYGAQPRSGKRRR